jgi:hypothetical protein
LREIRRQANDLYYENELIDNATDSLKEQLDNISNDVFTEEETSRFDTQTTERWRRAVLEAFRGSNLLEKLKLTPTSSTEDIILRIEANTKGNMEQAIRKCLNSIDFSGSSSV